MRFSIQPTPVPSTYFEDASVRKNSTELAIRGAGATVLCSVSSTILQTGSSFILARLLSPQDFGLVAMVLYFSLLLQNFGVNGFTEAIIQAENIDHNQINTLFWINASISACLALAFALMAPILASFYKEPRLISITILLSSSILFAGLSTEHVALMKRNMHFLKTSLNDFAANGVSVISAILLAWYGFGYWALVARWVMFPLATACGAWLICGWRPGFPNFRTDIGPLLKFALNTYGNFSLDFFRRNLDKILIGRFRGSNDLGHYDRAYQLFGLPASTLLMPLTAVALSALSKIRGDAETFRRQFLKSIAFVAMPGMLLTAVLTLIGKDLIVFLLGAQWHQAGEIFTLFCPALGIMMLYSTHGWLHLSLGRADRWFRWGAVALLVTASLVTAGIFLGPLGVAASYGISFYILLIPGLSYAGKPANLKSSSVLHATWKFYASGALSFLACRFGLVPVLDRLGTGTLVSIIVLTFACSGAYVLGIVILFRSTTPIVEFIRFFESMLSRSQKSTPKTDYPPLDPA